MLEEPEQNLEPQMQRSCVKFLRALCSNNAQIIIATHSPYVLSPIIDLKGVQRLVKSHKGELTCVDLGAISPDGWDFLQLRKKVPHDMELLEALFAPFVVIWEGDSEAGLYPTLMRQLADYPSEWLAGVNAGDAGLDRICLWFKQAGYETVVVLDGDSKNTLSRLSAEKIAFLALPSGKKIEHIVSDALLGLEDAATAKLLLSAIGFSGKINWRNEFKAIWPALAELFRKKELERRSMPTDIAIAEIAEIASQKSLKQSPSDIRRLLETNKGRRFYESIAFSLHKEGKVPVICSKILDALREIWNNQRPLGQYQFDEEGNIHTYVT